MSDDPTMKLLGAMRGGVVPVADEETERRQRDRTIRRINALAEETRKEQRQSRKFWTWAAVAAAVLTVVGATQLWSTGDTGVADIGPRVSSGDVIVAGAALTPGEPVPEGVALKTLREQATLTLRSAAQVRVAAQTSLRLERAVDAPGASGERLHLNAGTVELEVPKLPAGSTLAVVTPEATVEVHGTRFSVSVDGDGAQQTTSVHVTEGVVLVKALNGEHTLTRGQSWTSAGPATTTATSGSAKTELAPSATPAASEPPRGATAVAARVEATHSASPGAATAPSKVPTAKPRARAEDPSSLAEQNRLYHSAMHAKKNGLDELALKRLDALIARYPDSPLAQSAHVERMRILALLGKKEAASEAASDYLDRYPAGFATDEAKQTGSKK